MARLGTNGGWNRSHGTVERTPRIDSYEAGEINGWGTLFCHADGSIPIMLDCCHDTGCAPDRETVWVWCPKDGWSQTLELSRKRNGFGGSQAFFLCQSCGERRRYLYHGGAAFLCRKCARLNYKSQQVNRSDSMYYYDKGMNLVEKHLAPPPFFIDGFGFSCWIPDRPRYMHQSTYGRYLRRFSIYQDRHQKRQLADLEKILRAFK